MTPEHANDIAAYRAREAAKKAVGDHFEQTIRRDARYSQSQRQVAEAVDALSRDVSEYKQMPWRDLAKIVGNIGPAELWYVVMLSGNGKTTFFASFAEAMLARGDRVYVMATESTPHVFRTHLACRPLGYNPGDLLSGEYLKWPNAKEMRDAVIAEMEMLARAEGDAWENLTISDATHFSVESVTKAAHEAAEAKADWFLVDHVDHLGVGSGQSEYSVSFAANAALFDAKNKYGFRAFASSQVNHQVTKGNPLAYFTPPQDDWIKFGAHKKEKSDGVLTGSRVLKFGGVDDETLKQFKEKKIPMSEVAEAGMMMVTVLKHRKYGERLGQHCHLGVDRGRIVDLAEADDNEHGIRTNRDVA